MKDYLYIFGYETPPQFVDNNKFGCDYEDSSRFLIHAQDKDKAQATLREYQDLKAKLEGAGLRVELDLRRERIGHKIRETTLEKVPYMAIVGPKDVETGTVSARLRDGRQFNGLAPADFIRKLVDEAATKQTTPVWE